MGTTCRCVDLGSRVPSQGLAMIFRSRTAARKIEDTTAWMTWMVEGASARRPAAGSWVPSSFTHVWISEGRIEDSGRFPSVGYEWRRSCPSMCAALVGRCTCAARQDSAYSRKEIRPAFGSTYWPVTIEAVTSSSQRWASTFRPKWRACSRPLSSR